MVITLKTLDSFTSQEVFDYVVDNLRKQGCQSLENNRCRYRGLNGTKCAAGFLMSDDEYKTDYEGLGWNSIVKKYNFTARHKSLIMRLQHVHDEYFNLLEDSLRAVAHEFNLVYTPKV